MNEINKYNPILTHSNNAIDMFERLQSKINQVSGAPVSTGRTLLLKFLNGGKLTVRQSANAMCCECMGLYFDGRHDCENSMCPLYPFMPYGKFRKKYTRPEMRKDS